MISSFDRTPLDAPKTDTFIIGEDSRNIIFLGLIGLAVFTIVDLFSVDIWAKLEVNSLNLAFLFINL